MKTCFKCQRDLPRTDFYKHPTMADGLCGKCKDCARDDVAENRIKNIGRVREYDRARASQPHRRAAMMQTVQQWRARFPERRRAQHAVSNAVRDGRLAKPDACQRCGHHGRIEAHHADYRRPFDVAWLCKPCHCLADEDRRHAEDATGTASNVATAATGPVGHHLVSA